MTTITKAAQDALEALEEIALAGMSGSGQESEEGMRDWHARQAWKFIGIAARALDPLRAALQDKAVEVREPAFFTAWADSNGPVPLPGFSNEAEKGVRNLILQHARTEGYKGTIEGYLIRQNWWIAPVFAAPVVPDGFALVPMTNDTERLDWLAANPACTITEDSGLWFFGGHDYAGLREAIDAARGITAKAEGAV